MKPTLLVSIEGEHKNLWLRELLNNTHPQVDYCLLNDHHQGFRSITESDLSSVTMVFLKGSWPKELVIERFSHLAIVFSAFAGVDKLSERLPEAIRIVKMQDDSLPQRMYQYVLTHVLDFLHHNPTLRRQQQQQLWKPLVAKDASSTEVLVLGYGHIGSYVANQLHKFGFKVRAFSKQPKITPFLHTHNESVLNEWLTNTHVVINLLPNTPETINWLNSSRLNLLPAESLIINAGRGLQYNDTDLLTFLSKHPNNRAVIDVFKVEPLPIDHAFWLHSQVTLTPHIASITNPETAAQQLQLTLNQYLNHQLIASEFVRSRGY